MTTYRYAKKFKAQWGWEKLSLEYLSGQFGISQPDAHRAWCDAEANVGVYWKLRGTISKSEKLGPFTVPSFFIVIARSV